MRPVDKVNGMLLNDIKVYVGRHLSRRERLQQLEQVKANFTNVFVKNLDESVDDEQLSKLVCSLWSHPVGCGSKG